MLHRDTCLATQQAICQSQMMGRQSALNAAQGHNFLLIKQAIYRSQMREMIQPAYQNRVSV